LDIDDPLRAMDDPQYSHARRLLLLRTIVAALGERTAPPWWRTRFLTDVGLCNCADLSPNRCLGGNQVGIGGGSR